MAPTSPLHLRVYEAMAELIRSEQWAEGESLPSERVLVEKFGTSRGPVRQALARLRAEGLIAGGRGAPPRVQRSVPTQSFDTYLSFTEWAEELGYAPNRKTVELSQQLADEHTARLVEVEVGTPVVVVKRVRFFDDDPVMLEHGYYPREGGKVLLDVDLDNSSIYQSLLEFDIVPVRAHNVIDAVAAEAAAAHWLGVREGDPLLRLRRSSYDVHGSVVDYVENLYLPSMAAFAIENTRQHRTPITRLSVGDE